MQLYAISATQIFHCIIFVVILFSLNDSFESNLFISFFECDSLLHLILVWEGQCRRLYVKLSATICWRGTCLMRSAQVESREVSRRLQKWSYICISQKIICMISHCPMLSKYLFDSTFRCSVLSSYSSRKRRQDSMSDVPF